MMNIRRIAETAFYLCTLLGLLAASALAGTLPGDADGDYDVDLGDAIVLLQTAAGVNPGGINPGGLNQGGDADGDGRLGVADAIYAIQVVAGRRTTIPFNLFSVGDSISEAEAAENDIGNPHHESAWSTGYATNYEGGALSFNERLSAKYPAIFQANAAGALDAVSNKSKSGAEMADFYKQVTGTDTIKGVIAAAEEDTEAGKLGLISIMLGSNDACAATNDDTPLPDDFGNAFIQGLEALKASPATRNAHINVVGVPAIYWLWLAKRSNGWCRLIWPLVPCQNLLANPLVDDCDPEVSDSHLQPDTIYGDPDDPSDGDGEVCTRRKLFHRRIAEYNAKLSEIVALYRDNGWLPNIFYTDIFDIQFTGGDVNNGDCFHPSLAGQALLAEKTWCRSPWGLNDPACQP